MLASQNLQYFCHLNLQNSNLFFPHSIPQLDRLLRKGKLWRENPHLCESKLEELQTSELKATLVSRSCTFNNDNPPHIFIWVPPMMNASIEDTYFTKLLDSCFFPKITCALWSSTQA